MPRPRSAARTPASAPTQPAPAASGAAGKSDQAGQPGAGAKPGSAPKPATAQTAVARGLAKLGLTRDVDLALHLPLRYEDETRLTPLAQAREGDTVQFEATVVEQQVNWRPRKQLLVRVQDGDAEAQLRFFNFYPSQQKQMAEGQRLRIRGEVRGGFLGWTLMHPHVKAAGGALSAALTPVYPTVAGLAQPVLRKAVDQALLRFSWPELVPARLLSAMSPQPPWRMVDALLFLHHPAPDVPLAALEDHSHPAWQRLKAEELLAQQLSQQLARAGRQAQRAPGLPTEPGGLQDQLAASLPWSLTPAQVRVTAEIAADLAKPVPMHRLLQGDVGAGKTVVAALAAAVAMQAGWQCVLMAPTEILAEQHFAKLVDWLTPLLAPRGQCVAWLTGSQKKKEREAALAQIASGEAALVVGTHAVIQQQVVFQRLGLAIVDEQHRFGVAQRLRLRGMAGSASEEDREQADTAVAQMEPHLLMMSATPIPRTLAMAHYADLDVSTIDALPPGRTPVITKLVADYRRDEVIARIQGQLAQGRQVYWVCPLVEESEALDLRNATETHEELQAVLPGVNVGLLHARLPVAEKKAVMAQFTAGDMGVLVSTTVIEVGVDVPNASLMVIEHAERFGLSQLHQLRGRVGRGAAASACVLLYSQPEGGRLSEAARERLRAMAETSDGFEIARRDLEIRGPGEFLGARQSGAPLLRFADLTQDEHLLDWARDTAAAMLREHPQQAQALVALWLGGRADYLKA
ncbi:ATP-dependent DNA helicase RecG [Comamonas serinivorans]|uniref:ATP-dependent DNA helicase RecG n=1 Tax=Comamonas serinivorans TaxID=1082851 RepID=A0A1Y0ERY7_9BURK|nr:ATP-dependent DNA helicase RecG [Comamonas serinivorans]ARU06363.1 ATP-dependent DNA helicase RecG [Comamonas serinivorans]